ncbi:MAG TPA: triose-phosphate isomerase [Polyangia bacterium]|jgi:triosephosphate isomerase
MASDKQPVFAGNWKLFGSLAESLALAGDVKADVALVTGAIVIVSPGFLAITSVAELLKGSNVAVSGQDCSWETKGAFTGEVATAQLKDAGCQYVIVGHSERRALYHETDAEVNRKARAALVAGLAPIICVGETLGERDGGTTLAVVGKQLDAALADMTEADVQRSLIAYEPVWAIGTGRTATPAQAEEVHHFIRGRLQAKFPAVAAGISILYGGSVKPDNIRDLMAEENVDGALIGGASLSAESFVRIVKEGTEVWLRS